MPKTKTRNRTRTRTKPKSSDRRPAPRERKPARRSARGAAAFRVGCVYLQIQEMQRALDFYQRALGLPLVCRYGDEWAEVDAGGVRIGLHPAWEPGSIGGGGGATIAFYVRDLDDLLRRVREHGARADEPRSTERGRMATFHDSEGNLLHASAFDPRWVREAKYPLPAFARR